MNEKNKLIHTDECNGFITSPFATINGLKDFRYPCEMKYLISHSYNYKIYYHKITECVSRALSGYDTFKMHDFVKDMYEHSYKKELFTVRAGDVPKYKDGDKYVNEIVYVMDHWTYYAHTEFEHVVNIWKDEEQFEAERIEYSADARRAIENCNPYYTNLMYLKENEFISKRANKYTDCTNTDINYMLNKLNKQKNGTNKQTKSKHKINI